MNQIKKAEELKMQATELIKLIKKEYRLN